ncbi:hypothetical protein GH714_036746 [Hevea brasiliensis]|uniref:Uncharacterized protein n=1 Tax=Hevea brasiliensis TaxID=3981 RepID=A0A6A6M3D5_HEVBR|nr:hypothetical protein GH714_036746 [Hevea brasiliensis]
MAMGRMDEREVLGDVGNSERISTRRSFMAVDRTSLEGIAWHGLRETCMSWHGKIGRVFHGNWSGVRESCHLCMGIEWGAPMAISGRHMEPCEWRLYVSGRSHAIAFGALVAHYGDHLGLVGHVAHWSGELGPFYMHGKLHGRENPNEDSGSHLLRQSGTNTCEEN